MSENHLEFRHLLGSCCARTLANRPSRVEPHSVPWARPNYIADTNCKPLHQFLEIDLDITNKSLRGKNTIEIEFINNKSNEFRLNAVDLNISKVQWQNQDVPFSEKDQEIVVSLPKNYSRGEKGKVSVEYSLKEPRAGIYFIAPDQKYPDRDIQVWTQGQDDDSRYWFPCFDQPGTKFLSEMKITAPAGFICTSNGALLKEERGAERWTFHWKMSLPIPAYLVTLTAGKFSEIKDKWNSVPVHYLVQKGFEEQGKVSFSKTPKMMEHFSKKLGFPYPYEKYHQVCVSEFVFGGMENTTATTQTDATLHPLHIEPDFTSDDLVSHELAHQWFGDLVTCHSWSHGWLNESWATFMESVFREHDRGEDDAHYYRYEELQIYLNEDSSLYRRPIVTNVYSDPAEIWDRHLYQKGGLILNMLRAELGEEDFWKGTQLYLQRHQGKAVETVDFRRALEEVSQRSLEWFFDQWIYKGGHPDIKVEYEWDSKNKLVKIRVEQQQQEDAITPIHRINSTFEFHFPNGTSKVVSFTTNEVIKNLVWPMEEEPNAIRFDTDNHLLKTLKWDLPEKMIFAQLKLKGDVVGKVWAMKTLANKGSIKAQEALIDRLQNDEFWAVRKEAANNLSKITSTRAFDALVSSLKKESDSRVRTAIAAALGSWQTQESYEVLKDLAHNDQHEFVRSRATESLGKTKLPQAFDELAKLVDKSSWRDQIRSHAYKGFRHLGDERAVPLLIEGAHYGQPKWARLFAVNALGTLGRARPDVDSLLIDLLKDPFSRLVHYVLEAIDERQLLTAVSEIDRLANQTVDGHLKFAAHMAAKRLRKGQAEKGDVKNLRSTVEKLVKENSDLKNRLETIEGRLDASTTH